jgi:hypothetical protein
MPFQLSPGVNVSEIDLSTIVPAVATTDTAFVGSFVWGPVDEITLVNNQETLTNTFGKPDNDTAEHWFTASNFLDYGNKLHLVRVTTTTANNARSKRPAEATLNGVLIKNDGDFDSQPQGSGLTEGALDATDSGQWAARYPGAYGNNIRVSICDSYPGQFSNVVCLDSANTTDGSDIITVQSNTNFHVGDVISFRTAIADDLVPTLGNVINSDGTDTYEPPAGDFKIVSFPVGSALATDLVQDVTFIKLNRNVPSTAYNVAIDRKWEFYGNFDQAPGTSTYAAARGSANDEIHIAVSDATGVITGVKGQVLETYPNVSKARDAKADDGTSNYYGEAINQNSQYIRWCNAPDTTTADATTESVGVVSRDWGNTAFVADVVGDTVESFMFIEGADQRGQSGTALSQLWMPDTVTLHSGSNGYADTPAAFMLGYDMFADPEEIDISMILGGPHSGTISKYIIETIAEKRKDCVAFISPNKDDVNNSSHTLSNKTSAVKVYRLSGTGADGINSLSSSYGFMDSGWKYQYDKFNDKYRWVPLNGDIAGLCVRTDESRDPWWSPAGFNRGHIKNVVKLAWNPQKAHRDELYKNGINPVVTIPGQGTILFGDKTLQSKPSAFDRINVRRLFIVLEKAIATAAKFTLFEFNDEFTRSQFVNMVEPFLRDVQGRRGIYDFKVVCDTSNNTGEVIDRNEFVGDIYIKPARSINFIQLNFVAVRTGVDFEEVVGKF